jgi:hypothetical protein
MARSLGDAYRPLRLVLRVNGLVIGLLLGLLLLLAPGRWLAGLGFHDGGTLFPLRLAGVGLLGVGLFLLLASGAREIDAPVLIPCLVFHALLAVVLLVGYLRQELAVDVAGGVLLVVIFVLALVGALAPVRYFSAEYRF